MYQGALSSPSNYHKVDEEVEAVSTQLLKCTQAMHIKYRLLPLEESHLSAKMLMIDRTFIQEENTTPVLDKQLAKEKPNEYVSSSHSRPHALGLTLPTSSDGHRLSSHGSGTSSSTASAPPPSHLLTKLVIWHGRAGGSLSVTWAQASSSLSSSLLSTASSLDANEDSPMRFRNCPPIKT